MELSDDYSHPIGTLITVIENHYYLLDLYQLDILCVLIMCSLVFLITESHRLPARLRIIRKGRVASFLNMGFSKEHIAAANISGLLWVFFLQFFLARSSVAGPPLVIDDPGILDPGGWEVIAAIAADDRSDGKIMHVPLLDISLGLTTNTQISFFLPYSVIKPKYADTIKGLEIVSLNYKWRFASTDNWEWAIAANYTLPISHEIIKPDSPDDISILGLPVLASYTNGDWNWLGQVGWISGSDGSRFWDYGIAMSHPLGDSMQWMVEVYGIATSSFGRRNLNYQLGLDYGISPSLHLLSSVGSRIRSHNEPDSRLNYNFYFGLQWFSNPP
jgi:hypothetical protein